MGKNLVLIGGRAVDPAKGLSKGLGEHVSGAGSNQYVIREAGSGAVTNRAYAVSTVRGTSGDDYLIGTDQAEWIMGDDGNDTLEGLGGGDDLWGGSGWDTVSYWHAVKVDLARSVATSLNGEEGTDQLFGIEAVEASDENDVLIGDYKDNDLIGFGGNDSIEGGRGADILAGGLGNDTLVAGEGNDSLYGGKGNDVYRIDAVSDYIFELVDSGTDWLYASGLGTYVLADNVERLILTGAVNSSATGNAKENVITGNAGKNFLKGMGGADDINGGKGKDTLEGGAGSDKFVFSSALKNNVDLIVDFDVVRDVIALDNDVFNAFFLENVTLGQEEFYVTNGAINQAHDADDRIIYNATTGKLYYDADGNGVGVAVEFARLGNTTHPTITHQDFIIVA